MTVYREHPLYTMQNAQLLLISPCEIFHILNSAFYIKQKTALRNLKAIFIYCKNIVLPFLLALDSIISTRRMVS